MPEETLREYKTECFSDFSGELDPPPCCTFGQQDGENNLYLAGVPFSGVSGSSFPLSPRVR